MNNSKYDVKKRLMFLKGDDLYFLTYNILVLLKHLGCLSEPKAFQDHNKLAFLIDFIADPSLTQILNQAIIKGSPISLSDKHALQIAYTEGLMRRHILSRLVFALEKKSILTLSPCKNSELVCIFISSDMGDESFFDINTFGTEYKNVALLQKALPKLRTISFDTLISRLFNNNGVTTWRV